MAGGSKIMDFLFGLIVGEVLGMFLAFLIIGGSINDGGSNDKQ